MKIVIFSSYAHAVGAGYHVISSGESWGKTHKKISLNVLPIRAQPGLVWFVFHRAPDLVPSDLLENEALSGETVAARWMGLLAKIGTRAVSSQAMQALSATTASQHDDPKWSFLSQSWPRLASTQRTVLGDLVKDFWLFAIYGWMVFCFITTDWAFGIILCIVQNTVGLPPWFEGP